ncbi:MAG: hypothetical protein IPH59_14920 [bacterium]|nr:hypothetical protein [bacterium]
MALRTLQRRMPSDEWESRFAVIEFAIVNRSPASGIMTPGTIRSKAIGVRILVTGTTFGVIEARKLLVRCVSNHRLIAKSRMALRTLDLLVLAREWILCHLMIERNSWFPCRVRMAGFTLFGNLAAMFVKVAALALRRKSEKGPVRIFPHITFLQVRNNVLGYMTLPTL